MNLFIINMFIIQHFVDMVCHIIEGVDACMKWDLHFHPP